MQPEWTDFANTVLLLCLEEDIGSLYCISCSCWMIVFFFKHTKGILENTEGLNDINISDKVFHLLFSRRLIVLVEQHCQNIPWTRCMELLTRYYCGNGKKIFYIFSSELNTTYVFKTTRLENKTFQLLSSASK